MTPMTFLYATAALTALLLLIHFRTECTDFVYHCSRNWKHTIFILTCIGVGLGMGLYHSRLDNALTRYTIYMNQPKGDTILARIDSCKEFVTAKLERRNDYPDPDPPLTDAIKIGAKSYWDSCAHAFGTNYWKYDISIKGENGGQALCRAYRQDTYRSGNVETWCNTVFAEGRKI